MKLGEVIQEITVRNKKQEDLPVYSVTNSNGFMPSTEYFSKEVFSKDLSTYKIVSRNMLAYNPSRINVGSVSCLEKEERVLVSPLYVVFQTDDKKLNPEYLNLFLHSNIALQQIRALTSGSVRDSLKYSALSEMSLPIPDLSRQKEVIALLHCVTSLISLRRQQLDKLQQLAKSQFIEMFGDIGTEQYNYGTRKLGKVANIGSSHRVFTSEFVNSGIPFYRGTEIGELANGQKPSDPYFISEEHYLRLASDETKPKVGDLLMPSICNKGQVWMVDTEEPFYYKDGRVLCISPDRSVFNSTFLQYFMKEKTLVEYPKMGSGSTFAEFKIFLLKDMDVLIPPRELQEKFATFIEHLDKSKFALEQSIEKLETLYRSKLQEYFG